MSVGQDKVESNKCAGQDTMESKIRGAKKELKNDASAFRSDQTEFGKMTEMLNKGFKGVITIVEQQAQNFREEFNSELQTTRQDIEVAK
jgi:hypothetical protein